jgi:hypothetical protein
VKVLVHQEGPQGPEPDDEHGECNLVLSQHTRVLPTVFLYAAARAPVYPRPEARGQSAAIKEPSPREHACRALSETHTVPLRHAYTTHVYSPRMWVR